jgi:hypothetical protein
MNFVPTTAHSQPKRSFLAKAHTMGSGHRCLLALDGERVSNQVLGAAEARCLQLADRVDILLLNSPKAPITLLRKLLIKLERAGIDYRVTCSTGGLADQVANYLRHFAGIRFVMVDVLPSHEAAGETNFHELRHQGYRIIALTDMAWQNDTLGD